MSVFVLPFEASVVNTDLLCALLLLVMLSLKVMTLKQDTVLLKQMNRSLTISIYPLSLAFSMLMLQWFII